MSEEKIKELSDETEREFNLKVMVNVHPAIYKRDKDGKETIVSTCVRGHVKGVKEEYKQWLYDWHYSENREDKSEKAFEKYLESYALFYIYDALGIEVVPIIRKEVKNE